MKTNRNELIFANKDIINNKNALLKFREYFLHIKASGSEQQRIEAEYNLNEMLNDKSVNWIKYIDYIYETSGIEIGTGAEAIEILLKELNLSAEKKKLEQEISGTTSNNAKRELISRLNLIESFITSNNKPENMILRAIPVIPPDLRPLLPIDGVQITTSDINELYKEVINCNKKLADNINYKSPTSIIDNEKRRLQRFVDCLYENAKLDKTSLKNRKKIAYKGLAANLTGKQGFFRQNLLGKRVDYSGRSVIAIDPELNMDECGLPREMAIQLFKPHIVHQLIVDEKADTTRTAEKLVDQKDAKAYAALEVIIGDQIVLLNRAPTLHRLSIQAFKPKLVNGQAIRLHPLVTTGYNADFDGDQMAVHVPLSEEAKTEARILMIATQNILTPKDGSPIVTPSQDMILGNYYLTMEVSAEQYSERAKNETDLVRKAEFERYATLEGKYFSSPVEVNLAYQTKELPLHVRIVLPISSLDKSSNLELKTKEGLPAHYLITTAGKLIFNSIFDRDFVYLNEIKKSYKSNEENNFKQIPSKFLLAKGSNFKEKIKELDPCKPFGKSNLAQIIDEVYNKLGTAKTSIMLDKLKNQGFDYSTISGVTFSMGDMPYLSDLEEEIAKTRKEVEKINAQYGKGKISDTDRYNDVIAAWNKRKDDISSEIKQKFDADEFNSMSIMLNSGARGNTSQFTQIVGIRGLMASPTGKTIEIPITSNLKKGLSVSEYFISTHGGRKGGADTALKTSKSGYLTRKLADVAHSIVVSEEDCGTDHGFVMEDIKTVTDGKVNIYKSNAERLTGRYTIRPIYNPSTGEEILPADHLITKDEAEKITLSGLTSVEVRSVLGCRSKKGICAKCYGLNLATGKPVDVGEAVGIIAAQSIGEPGTQLTMRTFHTGGVASGDDITQGLPRVEELFEARKNLKNVAVITEIEGIVKEIETGIDGNPESAKITIEHDLGNGEVDTKTYDIRNGIVTSKIIVAVGDYVKLGDKLTRGVINTYKLLEIAGISAVQKYILEEVQKVYGTSNIKISDKHIEIILKQMFQKVYILDRGNTKLSTGEFVTVADFIEKNKKILIDGKIPAVGQPVLQGIKTACITVPSFLSAVSFQETAKTLSEAAIHGRIDTFEGLKENVMVGKLIPAGTGLDIYKNLEEKQKEVDLDKYTK